jgi:hypothetical protein
MAGEQRSFLILSRTPPDSNFQRRKFTSIIPLRLHISLDAIRVKMEFAAEKSKKPPLRRAWAVGSQWRYAIPRRQRWERRPRGEKRKPP